MDLVKSKNEETVEGMEKNDESSEPEVDEHVWTSPKNAISIVRKLNQTIDKIDKSGKAKYDKNADKYEKELAQIDQDFQKIVDSGKRREIVVGDRFPLRYFADEYGLKYYAAFPGCSEQTEASSETITFLTRKVKEDKIPVVLKMELSKGNIAKTIADETDAKVLEFNSAHNISQKDFDAGVTYVDIMKRNENIMREALN
jgi:zinc transport system substrate-binding protein